MGIFREVKANGFLVKKLIEPFYIHFIGVLFVYKGQSIIGNAYTVWP